MAVWEGNLLLIDSEVHMFDNQYFVRLFASIRSEIDALFTDWHGLPNSWEFALETADAKKLYAALRLEIEDVGDEQHPAEYSVESELSVQLSEIASLLYNLDLFAGEAMSAFRLRYARRSMIAIGALSAMSQVCGGHVAAEGLIWGQVAVDLRELFEGAHAAFTAKAAENPPIDWVAGLKVLGTAAKGAGIIATGTGAGAVVGAAISGAGLVIEVVSSAVASTVEAPQIAASTYSEIVESIRASLAAENKAIFQEEDLIRKNCVANLQHITGEDKSSYDLTGAIFDDQNRPDGEIRFDPVNDGSVSTAMRIIAAKLDAASKYYAKLDITEPSTRTCPRIGIGQTGPAPQVLEFATTLQSLIVALSAEFIEGAAKWDALSAALQSLDRNESGKIQVMETEVDLGPYSDLEGDPGVIDPLAVG